jgi:uncharacterized protein YjeT (DUF2065 family)
MRDFATALALAVVIEGLLYLAFPDGMRRMLEAVSRVPTGQIRIVAFVAALAGLGVTWLLRSGRV